MAESKLIRLVVTFIGASALGNLLAIYVTQSVALHWFIVGVSGGLGLVLSAYNLKHE